MKNSFFKKNGMFLVFLLLAFIALGVSVYTGLILSGVEYQGTTAIIEGGTVITLVVVLTVAMITVVLCGFWGMSMYSRKADQAEKANRAKTEFFSRMSHDMRTPMSAILGLCRIASESDNIAEIRRHLETVNESANHLLMLINDVLEISRIEAGRLQLDQHPTNLRDEISRVVGLVVPDIDETGKEIKVEVAENVPKYVLCDSVRLRQVVVNLLGNAIKFTGDDGLIEISVSVGALEDSRVRLVWHVKDNGVGMDTSLADCIFNPFGMETGSGNVRYQYGGTGLGLPIAKQLVQLMGGNIEVSSAFGYGSDFKFDIWLPLSSAEQHADWSKKDSTNAKIDLTGKRALVFEDLSTNRTIAENVLQRLGATVEFAGNGLQGVNIYIANPDKYDYIFMDIKMPVMDGYEATKQIRSSNLPGCKSIPIIAMTANAFREDAHRAIASGMNAHIGKPFSEADVVRTLKELAQPGQAAKA